MISTPRSCLSGADFIELSCMIIKTFFKNQSSMRKAVFLLVVSGLD